MAPRSKTHATPSPKPTPSPLPPSPSPVPATPLATAQPQAAAPFVLISSLAGGSRVAREQDNAIPELRQAVWMNGTWDAHLRLTGPGRQFDLGESSYVIGATMKGRWIFGAEGKSRDFFFLGYDPLAGHWVMIELDRSLGYALLTAPLGWQNGHLSLYGDTAYTSGQSYRKRTTILRRSAREFTITDEQVAPDGSYLPLDRYDFTKAP